MIAVAKSAAQLNLVKILESSTSAKGVGLQTTESLTAKEKVVEEFVKKAEKQGRRRDSKNG